MRKLNARPLMLLALTLLTGCLIAGPAEPYAYSPNYCEGCWHGTWAGREGWHRGGGRPWEQPHYQGDPLGEGHGGEGPIHEGHN